MGRLVLTVDGSLSSSCERRHERASSRFATSGCGHGVPGFERTRTQQPLRGSPQRLSSDAEKVPHDMVDGKEGLDLRS
jgi:hypothetical protein